MKRHRFDPFSFLFGALFLTIGLTVATGGSGVDVVRPFRSWPIAVILTGLVLVLWTASRVVRSLGAEGTDPIVDAEGAPAAVAQGGEGVPGAAEEADWAGHRDTSETETAELDETPPP
jgi:hypothetical protein